MNDTKCSQQGSTIQCRYSIVGTYSQANTLKKYVQCTTEGLHVAHITQGTQYNDLLYSLIRIQLIRISGNKNYRPLISSGLRLSPHLRSRAYNGLFPEIQINRIRIKRIQLYY